MRLSDAGSETQGTSAGNGAPKRARSATAGSGSDSQHGSESRHARRDQRVGSTVSVAESQYSNSPTPGTQHASLDEPLNSPPAIPAEASFERSPALSASPRDAPSGHPSRRNSLWIEGQRADSAVGQRNLPSLSDMFDSRSHAVNGMPAAGDANGYGGYPRPHHATSPGPPPGLVGGESRPPPLRKDYSSAASSSSSFSHPRTPIEGSLPIHALLSGKPTPPFDSSSQLGALGHGRSLSPDGKISLPYPSDRSSSDHSTTRTGKWTGCPLPLDARPPNPPC